MNARDTANESAFHLAQERLPRAVPSALPRVMSRSVLACAIGIVIASNVLAYDAPGNIRYDSGALYWESNAPSVSIYEDGVYKTTLHGAESYEAARDGAVYRLVAHDRDRDFSVMSDGFVAGEHDDDDDEDSDETTIPFTKDRLLLQLNDTDGDLGFHARLDGEPWKTLSIRDPSERTIFSVVPKGQLKDLGMTEVSFESHEPPFDELDPARFFAEFPEGEYEISGRTIDGRKLESEVQLSHVIPAPVRNIAISGAASPPDCEEDSGPIVSKPLTIYWDPVTHSHPELGRTADVSILGYQLVLEREEPTPLKFQVDLDASDTSFLVPQDLVDANDEFKIEVLVVETNGNETGTEGCFVSAD